MKQIRFGASVADAVVKKLGSSRSFFTPYSLRQFRLETHGAVYYWAGIAVDPGDRVQSDLRRQCS